MLPAVGVLAVCLTVLCVLLQHASAILFAYRNKMDSALGVAVGSSTQISVCVIPFMVLVGWGTGQPLTLYFEGFETMALFASVLLVAFLIQAGESNWLMGCVLIAAYVIVAIGFWDHSDEASMRSV